MIAGLANKNISLLSVGKENINLKPIEMEVCLIKPPCSYIPEADNQSDKHDKK